MRGEAICRCLLWPRQHVHPQPSPTYPYVWAFRNRSPPPKHETQRKKQTPTTLRAASSVIPATRFADETAIMNYGAQTHEDRRAG